MTERSELEREHAAVWATLPWCVAGSASAEELARAQRHLADCADCSTEWEFNQRLRRGLANAAADATLGETTAGTDATDAALARLWRRIDADAAMAWPDEHKARREGSRWGSRWFVLLAAASVLQAVGLGTLALLWWQDAGEARFETLSREPAPAAPQAPMPPPLQLQIQLDPGTSPAEAEALARRLRAEPRVRDVQPMHGPRPQP